jgi:A/G-specific adenine glycosylase
VHEDAGVTRAKRPRADAQRRDADIVRAVSRWFLKHQRPLPWREQDPVRGPGFRDAYRSLVSEFMLQQTQVSRVLEKFNPFLARFPTVRALADAREHDVLAAWTGLGYYRRARLLHAAARTIIERHAGVVPELVEELEALPGVGRYTAGAVVSMAHGQDAALVDTNVSRVLLRVEGKSLDSTRAAPWAWERAGALAACAHHTRTTSAGTFNEGLMELGALVCISGSPRCGACPLSGAGQRTQPLCVARAKGWERRIPRVKAKPARTPTTFIIVIARDARGRVLLEQRPAKGLWANLWQPPTLELGADAPEPTGAALRRSLGLKGATALRRTCEFPFNTTHREVRCVVWECGLSSLGSQRPRRWVAPSDLRSFALSSPVRRALGV